MGGDAAAKSNKRQGDGSEEHLPGRYRKELKGAPPPHDLERDAASGPGEPPEKGQDLTHGRPFEIPGFEDDDES